MNEVKHKRLLLLLFSFAISTGIFSQSGWYTLNSGTNSTLKSVHFLNTNTGYMAGDGIILKTFNGGLNWLIISSSVGGKSIYFVNPYTGYICDGSVHKTTDGGVTWTNFNLTLLNYLYFVNEYTGYAAGKNSQILKTTNGGLNWEEQFISLFLNEFNCIKFINTNTGFIAGGRMQPPYYGVIYKTTNGGVTWLLDFSQAPDISFTGIAFPTALTGYAVGQYEYGSSGVIYKTTNGGETWVQQGIVNKDLFSVSFPSALTGYAVGEEGTILKTTNGSIIWNSQISNNNNDIYSVYFVRNDIGYTSGSRGSVQKTVNGGNSGPPFAVSGKVLNPDGSPVTSGYVKALRYNWSSDVIAVLDSAGIQPNGDYILPNLPIDTINIMAYPNDAEENIQLPPFVPSYYTGTNQGTIYWRNSRSLFVNGNLFERNIYVLRTFGSGGVQHIGGGVFTAPPNINGLRGAIVYAMTGNEFKGFGISKTGGPYTVNQLPPGSYTMICDRFGYRDAQRSVTIGNYNLDTINFYLIHINLIGITPISSSVPSNYSLEQNYPNPFNPLTRFKIGIPVESQVQITVYDMIGREIETLVNSELPPGSYSIEWNGTKYSSGIYFYRITAQATMDNLGLTFNDVKKMILVK